MQSLAAHAICPAGYLLPPTLLGLSDHSRIARQLRSFMQESWPECAQGRMIDAGEFGQEACFHVLIKRHQHRPLVAWLPATTDILFLPPSIRQRGASPGLGEVTCVSLDTQEPGDSRPDGPAVRVRLRRSYSFITRAICAPYFRVDLVSLLECSMAVG